MKKITMDNMKIIHAGEEWIHSLAPCSKNMSKYLESNERIVSWLQPCGGKIEEQIPVLKLNGEYYKLSLRMMKSIWRHVRLKKDFVNKETAQYGGMKLRIPHCLYVEKMRTQNRFKLMRIEKKTNDSNISTIHASGKIYQTIERALIPILNVAIEERISFKECRYHRLILELICFLHGFDFDEKALLISHLNVILKKLDYKK